MSFDSESAKLGRQPFLVCSLIMDHCSLVAGVGACTATETGDDKCYNTRATCNDTANYDKTTKEYKFCEPTSEIPFGEELYPVLDKNIQKAATSVTGGSGLGKRAVINVDIGDFPHHDRGIDPYHSERTYNAFEQGTFWGKWLARNPYYEGRTLKIGYGYIGETFSWNDFEFQEYDIVDIHGVTNKKVKIIGKDILVRTYDRKAQYPSLNTGVLDAGIAAGAGSAILSPVGIGDAEYSASGTLSIGSEAFTFTRAGDNLTLTANSQWGTLQEAHDAGDTVQECVTWSSVNVTTVLDELLTTGAGIPSSYIPSAEWATEAAAWLSLANVTGILMKPESIEKVIGELSTSFLFDIWWDSVSQAVKIKALSPELGGETINRFTEVSNIIKGSLKIQRDSKQRFTEVRVFYDKANFSEDDKTENFKVVKVSTNPELASPDLYDGNSIKTVKSRWFDSLAQANTLSSRLLARFSTTPETVTFDLDQKDYANIEMAGRADINSWQFQDKSGANTDKRFQILEITEKKNIGNVFTVKAFTSSFKLGNYAFIAPDSQVDYLLASDAEKSQYGFICEDIGQMSNGDNGYYII